ncbi:hypothetical protein PPACK8108_LOCUS19328 [Phakopsora pachyrhizi]|uniref:Cytochrome c oxidase assembly protein COX20, mitochondrial n=1 Tax=Phakopsora pachyrhizi TaxID=170000 RepID=A0AAV0BER8_PHAPC|nr:hypothetical protein PPACK8108_LOCUS19328 [Phakopsora pachyrhizi]
MDDSYQSKLAVSTDQDDQASPNKYHAGESKDLMNGGGTESNSRGAQQTEINEKPRKIPFWAKRLLSTKDQDHEIAYQLQVKGAKEGAIRWTIYSTILCGMGHLYWPFFRKQTLALKGFLVSSAAMSGMVIWADYYLLRHERYLRKADDMMRREARRGERGIIATETELNKWKQQKIEILKDHK